MDLVQWLRVVVLGIVEGITEWVPVSSTGHLIILNEIWKGNETVFTAEFTSLFDVVIQLGAILAVVSIFFHKLNPFSPQKTSNQKINTWKLWLKIVISVLPAVFAGLLLDDWMDEHLYNWITVSITLILYGVLFFILESRNNGKDFGKTRFSEFTNKDALLVGLIQLLALVPGTSRSGVTILGAMFLGCSRYIATEYTFFLAIPMMFGASVLKLFKYFVIKGLSVTNTQVFVLLLAMAVAYGVSLIIVNFLMKFVKRHSFKAFGIYRILLGILVIVLFAFVLK